MHPILFELGPLAIPSYGVMIATAVGLALWTAARRAEMVNIDGQKVVDLGLWIVLWALLGAKLMLVIVGWRGYLADPASLLGILRAAGHFLSGFVVGLIAAVALMRRYGLPFLKTLDLLAPSVALGHAVGRIGCLLAGCCWGKSCDLPWAITYSNPDAAINVGTPLGVPLHPSPIYESIFTFSLFILLDRLHARRPEEGITFAVYMGLYGMGRFVLEIFRGDEGRGAILDGMFSTSQTISIGLIVGAIVLAVWRLRSSRS